MLRIKASDDSKLIKRKIQNRLEDAFKQAEAAFLEIPVSVPLELVREAVKGKLSSSKRKHIVYVKHDGEWIIW